MKRIILLLMCIFAVFSVSAQTPGGKKDKGYKTVNTWAGKSALPSYRSEKHLKSLKENIQKPFRSKSTSTCKCISKSRVPRKIDKITFLDLNYALSLDSHHSIGLTFGQVKRIGYYVSATTSLSYKALTTDIECDKIGFVNGEMQYYSGETRGSRYSVIAGAMLRLSAPLALKVGVGYGGRALAWGTADGGWIRNSYYTNNKLELSAGMQLLLNDFNMSLDVVGNRDNLVEFKIGIGLNIK